MPVPLGKAKENDFPSIRDKSRTEAEPSKHTGSIFTVKKENYNNGPKNIALKKPNS